MCRCDVLCVRVQSTRAGRAATRRWCVQFGGACGVLIARYVVCWRLLLLLLDERLCIPSMRVFHRGREGGREGRLARTSVCFYVCMCCMGVCVGVGVV